MKNPLTAILAQYFHSDSWKIDQNGQMGWGRAIPAVLVACNVDKRLLFQIISIRTDLQEIIYKFTSTS
jgi:hypothetical protein